jgi:hypothetical protein
MIQINNNSIDVINGWIIGGLLPNQNDGLTRHLQVSRRATNELGY